MGSDGSLIFDTDLDTKGFERGSAKLTSAVNSFVKSVAKIGNLDIGSARFQTQVANAKESLAGLQQRLEEMGSKTITTENYEYVTQSISKAEQALIRLVKRQEFMSRLGVSENNSQWKRLELQIQDAEAALERLNAQKEQMEADGTAFIFGADTEQYNQLSAALEQARAQLEEYEAAQENLGRVSWVSSAVSGLTRVLGGLARVLGTVASAAWTAAKNIAKLSFRAVSSGIRSAISALKSFSTESNRANTATKGLLKGLTSVKTMLISRVKRMFISYIFNEMKEAMNALEQYDKSFGTAMNNMKSAAKGLSANLAVSFGGLITAIEPVLTRIINAISTAISYLNALFAMLGGKSTVTVAKKQMNDYGKAAGGAGKKVEELRRQVYSFDELNRRSKDSDSGGGGGGANAADLFEEVPIDSYLPDSVKDFFERIKAAFEAGDWEEIGRIVAEGLNTGMKIVDDWITGTLQPLAFTWSERVARMLNGLVEGVDWGLMGKTVADGANTVFGTLNIFLSTFDFDALGRGFGEGINSIFSNVRWDVVGQYFANKWNALIGFIHGVVTTTDWVSVGSSISTAVTSWFTTIDWVKAGQSLSEGVKGVLTALSTFLEKTNWQEMGNRVASGIAAIDWGGVTSALFRGIGAALGGLAAFLWGLIQDAWNSTVNWWKNTAYEDGQFTMEGLLRGIGDKLKSIGSWIKTNIFDPFINGFKNAFGIHSPSTVMQEQGGFIIDGLLLGIKNAWTKITSFFSTSLSGLKSTLSTAWSNIQSAASTAWTNISSSVTNKWNTMKSTLSTGISSLKSTISTGWNSISTAATQAWSTISTSVTSKWNSLKSTLQNTNWSSVGSNICTGIGNGINSGWSWLTSRVSSLASSLLSSAKRALGIHSPSRVFRDEIGENIGLGLAEGIENSEKDVNRSVAALAKSTADGFGNQNLSFDVSGSEMISGLDRVADKLSAIADTFRAITSMLDNVGSLNVPQIAAGTVVPPKVRAGSYSGGDPDSGFASFAGDFDGFVSDFLRYNERIIELLEALNRKRLTVDALSVQRELTTYQRNFGGV